MARQLIAALLLALPGAARAQGAAACVLPPNAVVKENCFIGRQSAFWDGGEDAPGLLSESGASPGETLKVRADLPGRDASVEIYRLGYYAGFGARLISTLRPPEGAKTVDFDWRVPDDALSGIYVAVASAGRKHLRSSFVVRESTGARRDVVVLVGGDACAPALRCLLSRELPLLRFLERNGFDAAYVDAGEAAIRPERLLSGRVIATAADDAAWNPAVAAAVAFAREAGAAAVFLGAPGSADPPAGEGYERPLTISVEPEAPLWRGTDVADAVRAQACTFPELAGPRVSPVAPAPPSLEPPEEGRGGCFRSRAARWVWGLDNRHEGGSGSAARRAIRQATLNAFTDLGAIPGALEPGLRASSRGR